MSGIGKPFEEVRRQVALHLAALLIVELLFSAVGGLIGHIIALEAHIRPAFRPYIIVISGLLAALLALWAYRRFSKFIPRFPRVNADFLVEKTEIHFEFESDSRIRYYRRRTLRARRSGLSRYYDRYSWSGSGPVLLSSGKREHTIRLLGKQNTWQLYTIEFNRTLRRGDTVSTEVIWEIDDSSQTSQPFVGTSIREPTKALIFHLRFPPSLDVRNFTAHVSLVDGIMEAIHSEDLELTSTGEVTWVPGKDHPKLLHYYEIRWQYTHRDEKVHSSVKPLDNSNSHR